MDGKHKKTEEDLSLKTFSLCFFCYVFTFSFFPAECELGPAQLCVKTQTAKIVLHVMAFSDVILDNFKAFSAHF